MIEMQEILDENSNNMKDEFEQLKLKFESGVKVGAHTVAAEIEQPDNNFKKKLALGL